LLFGTAPDAMLLLEVVVEVLAAPLLLLVLFGLVESVLDEVVFDTAFK
jgi:hypothetical protein